MKEEKLKRKATEWLETKSKEFKTRPHSFTPKEVADAVGGYAGSLGKVATEVVTELNLRGVNIKYSRSGNKRSFELL